jgi:osmotically-inducible protein OsmY
MSSDMKLRQEIETELDRCANVDLRQIGVAVKHGIVTLNGHVGSAVERAAAQETSQSVTGVRAVVNYIVVNSASDGSCSDADVAEETLEALQTDRSVSAHRIKIAVHDGCIELQGQVSSSQQKTAVETVVMSLPGVKSLVSDISIHTETATHDSP